MKKVLVESCGYCQEFWHCPVIIKCGGLVQAKIPENCPLPDEHSITNEAFNTELAKRWPSISMIREVFHNEFYGVNWLQNELSKPK